MFRRHVAIGVGLLTATGLLAACSSVATNSASGSAPVAGANRAPAAVPANGFIAGSPGPALQGITIGVPPTAYLQRSVRATYTIPPGTFLASFDGVIARAVALGGYVASSATRPASDGRIVAGSVTLDIPAARIAAFLNAMPSTFRASSIDFASVDHTAAFVDVNAELVSAHAHLHALDALLGNATTLSDITTLEQQIETVQVEIDTYQGELNTLSASVDMATATIALSERGVTLVASAPGPVNDGLSSGWHNAVQVTGTLLDALITALPVLVIAALALAGWRLIPRRLRRAPRSVQ
jgi:Domain of unknown function (DUF4349)